VVAQQFDATRELGAVVACSCAVRVPPRGLFIYR